MVKGITLKEKNTGQEFGPSKVAAQAAIMSTVWSRAFGMVGPAILTPGIFNMVLTQMKLMPKPNTPLRMIVELSGVALGLTLAITTSSAFYP